MKIKKLDKFARVPEYQTEGSAGFDLCSNADVIVHPGDIAMVPTGLVVEVPKDCEMQIRPRSGLSLKYPNYIVNSPGTIDSDYRGEVKILICNPTLYAWVIKKGARIAQAILSPVIKVDFEVEEELSETERGAGGFGSTGV